jgi:hypothetical protein
VEWRARSTSTIRYHAALRLHLTRPSDPPQTVLSTSLAELHGATPAVVAVEAAGLVSVPQLDVIALSGSPTTGQVLLIRAVHTSATPTTVNVTVPDCVLSSDPTARVRTLRGNLTDQNTPAAPTAVVPLSSTLTVGKPGAAPSFAVSFDPFSLTTIAFNCSPASAPPPVLATTCDLPSAGDLHPAVRFNWSGHSWEAFNLGPWATVAALPAAGSGGGSSSLALPCGALDCFDEAVLTDATLPPSGTTRAAVNVTLAAPAAADGRAHVAGLLVRCETGTMAAGMDAFNCYEVSLSPNVAGRGAGSGYVMLGAHILPGAFTQLAKVAWDLPASVSPYSLSVRMTTASAAATGAVTAAGPTVMFSVLVNGVTALSYTDAQFADVIKGGGVAVRAFYQDATWSGFEMDPAGQRA